MDHHDAPYIALWRPLLRSDQSRLLPPALIEVFVVLYLILLKRFSDLLPKASIPIRLSIHFLMTSAVPANVRSTSLTTRLLRCPVCPRLVQLTTMKLISHHQDAFHPALWKPLSPLVQSCQSQPALITAVLALYLGLVEGSSKLPVPASTHMTMAMLYLTSYPSLGLFLVNCWATIRM